MYSPLASNLVKDCADIGCLKKELVETSTAYGYTPSADQAIAIAIDHISKGKHVFMQTVFGNHTPDTRMDEGTYMVGKIPTLCLGILNQLDLSDPVTCQCLIITYDSSSFSEIIEDMERLGGSKVKVAIFDAEFQLSDAHVILEDFGHQYDYPWFSCPNLKMLVFDWGFTPTRLDYLMTSTQWIFENMRQGHSPRQLQFVFTSQSKCPDDDFNVWLRRELKIQFLSHKGDMRWDLKRIKNHNFSNVDVGLANYEEMESKVEEVVVLIEKVRKPGKPRRIVIFVSCLEELKAMTMRLRRGCYKFSQMHNGMTYTERNRMVDNFLADENILLITLKKWHRDMRSEYFSASVCAIIYFDYSDKNYTGSLGWFMNVETTIAVVDNTELNNLLAYQKSFGIRYGRFGGAEKESVGIAKESLRLGSQVHHPLLIEKEEDYLRDQLYGMSRILVAAGKDSTTCAFLVEDVEKIVKDLDDIFNKDSAQKNLVVTSCISEVAKRMKDKDGHYSCVYVTCDITTKMDEINDRFMISPWLN